MLLSAARPDERDTSSNSLEVLVPLIAAAQSQAALPVWSLEVVLAAGEQQTSTISSSSSNMTEQIMSA